MWPIGYWFSVSTFSSGVKSKLKSCAKVISGLTIKQAVGNGAAGCNVGRFVLVKRSTVPRGLFLNVPKELGVVSRFDVAPVVLVVVRQAVVHKNIFLKWKHLLRVDNHVHGKAYFKWETRIQFSLFKKCNYVGSDNTGDIGLQFNRFIYEINKEVF